MKKFLAFLLVVCTCTLAIATFAACGGSDGTGDGDDNAPTAGVTEDVWEDALEEANFNNVTFSMNVSTNEGDSEFVEIKLVGDSYAVRESLEEEFEVDTDPETVASVKNVYVNTVLAIADNFSDFTYDATNDCYKASSDIVYTVTVQGINASITTKDTVVTLNAQNGIAKIVCEMTQSFVSGDQPNTLTFDVEFTFSNYGTTTLD
jgi:hypothetical protein